MGVARAKRGQQRGYAASPHIANRLYLTHQPLFQSVEEGVLTVTLENLGIFSSPSRSPCHYLSAQADTGVIVNCRLTACFTSNDLPSDINRSILFCVKLVSQRVPFYCLALHILTYYYLLSSWYKPIPISHSGSSCVMETLRCRVPLLLTT
jgi:hypothetical protein